MSELLMAVGKRVTLPDGLIVRPYDVTVRGWPGTHRHLAASRGKALADAWRCDAFCGSTFGEFLRFARAKVSPYLGERFGEQIEVCGKPAFYVGHNSQYIQFVRPESNVVLNAHPFDVNPPEARRGTPYYGLPLPSHLKNGSQ